MVENQLNGVKRLGLALLFSLPLMGVSLQAKTTSHDWTSKASSFCMDSIRINKEKREQDNLRKLRFRKGDKFVGANLSFGGKEAENDFLVANIDLPDVQKQYVNASFVVGYFLSPRTSVGFRGRYNYGFADQTLVADFLGIAFNADEYRTQSVSSGFEMHGFARNYIALGSGRTFYMFNETSVYYGYKGSYSRAISDPGKPNERIRKIRSDNFTCGFGISPGITYFSSERMAFELQLGTSGFEYTHKKHLTDNVTEGKSNQFTFRNGFSFLRVQFGLTYYFN